MNTHVAHERVRSAKIKATLVAVLGIVLAVSAQAVVPMAPAQAAAPTPFSAKINFGPATSATPSGYTQDTGAAYSDATGRGWVRQDSLEASTHVPLDLPLNTRDRGAAAPSCATGTPQGRTFIHMQAPVTNATNSDVKGAWEQAVPNGQYKVEVGYGDASLGADAESHTLNVEGVSLVKNDPGSFAQNCTVSRMRSATGWVTVADGRLTVDAVGGTNTKLAYVTIDSVPVAGLTATTGASSVSLDWEDVAGATYKVWRAEALPAPTSGQAQLVQLGGVVSESGYTDTSAEPGVRYHYAVGTSATPAAVNGAVVQATIDSGSPTRPALPLKVDFQDRAGATAAGYTADFGRAYSNTRGFGWVQPGTQTPFSIVGNGRTRTGGTAPATAAVLQSSMMHVQYNATGYNQTNGVQRQGAWQVAVPDGRYDVELTVGDREPGTDATRHVVHVEGTDAVNYETVTAAGVALTGAARFRTATVPAVRVTDGFLTIDAIGGTNTKLTDLTITANTDDLAPDAPTGLTATAGDASVVLDWADNTEEDLAGYRVYRAVSLPVATSIANLVSAGPLDSSTFTDTTAVNGTTYHYVVVAVDDAGQASPASAAVSATPDTATPSPLALPARVNFVATATPVAEGFLKDSGEAFTRARGYGWVTPGTGAPLDLSGNGRLRDERTGVSVDVRQRGLVHLQADDITGTFSGTKSEGVWEATVPDGRYRVTVSVGDQPGAGGVYDSVHSLNVEGVPAITRFQATASDEFETATVTVPVTDGRLTIDGAGGTNTKINFVDVVPAAPAAPTALGATSGDNYVGLSWTASTSADVTGYRVYRGAGATPTTTGEPLATVPAPGSTYDDLTAQNGTAYSYVVVAVAGDEVSEPSGAVTATPVDEVAPATPVGVNAAPGDGSVSLTWSGGQASDIESFRVYRSTSPDVATTEGNLVVTRPGAEPTYVDQAVTNGTPYYYVVTAVDEADNESEASDEVSATPTVEADTTAPGVPQLVVATPGDATVTLSWTGIIEAADLRGYRVYRSATPGDPGTVVSGDTPVEGNGYLDRTALNGTTYYYTVTAVDTSGNESARSAEASATPADTTAPAAVTGTTATGAVNAVTVTWDAAPEGSDVALFQVYRATTAGATFPAGFFRFGTFDAAQRRTFTDANVTAGQTYYYVVTALDAAGNESAASPTVNATPLPTPDTTAPSAPTGLTAAVDGDDVTLTWTASASADTAGYEVYRAATDGATPTKISSAGLSATTFTDSDRPAGSTGYYTIRALDTANNQSAPSATVQATIAQAAIDLAYAFQTAAGAVPAGFTRDTGAAYSTAAGRGWITQASVATQTRTPLDLTDNTRVRTRAGVTDLQNRLIHLQYGDIVPVPTANGSLTPGAWEHVLPNGRYTVTASVGDQPGAAKTGCAAPCYDSRHVIRAEGVAVVPGFQATAANEYQTASTTVDVVDGRLTIDAIGGTNTKLNWVRILSAGPIAPDTTAPAAPTGLLASPGDRSATLSWSAPADNDVAGYDVFRSTSTTVEPSPATKVNTSPVLATSFADSGLVNGTPYTYVVRAVDTAGNTGPASTSAVVTPAAGAAADVSIKVDFSDAATATPATGYLLDYGQGFGPRTGANQGTDLSYGWVRPDTTTPVSLVGNGRDRRVTDPALNEPDARRATLMHMQYAGTAAGSVAAPGSWEVAVPNGLYSVRVDVGDVIAVDSAHWVNIENQNAVAAFTPTTSTRYATATRTVAVTDGRITLSPIGGTNTKITYVDIASFAQNGRPYSETVQPLNGTTDVVTNISPTASNELPGGAVSETTVTNGVRLTRVLDGAPVAGVGDTSGGGDTVSFRLAEGETLLPSTLYRFDVLASATDTAGNSFIPFSSVFTTKADSTNPGGSGAAFDKTDSGATRGGAYTSLVFGPDGKLYAGSIFGQIFRWTVRPDGTLTDETVIDTVRTHASAAGWEGAPNRTIIGLAFDPASTPDNPILWITDNYAYLGSDVPNGTGAIARLTGPNLERYEEVVVNLPRSIKDHETNSIAFHDGKMYITQGSINAMGAQDGTWKKPENLLSAAVLELDPAKLPSRLPLDVSTPDLVKASGNPRTHAGTYNPYAPGAPLTLYATGVRNAFDLVWHSNGNLYSGTNGSAAGGNTPAVPNPLPASCANRPDGGYTGPSAPALTNNRQDETDYVFNIKKGKYYGHPNPLRCEYILNAGNPTGYTGNPLFKVNAYPAGQRADPNYDLGNVYDAGMHASANGTVEYQNAGAFGGALKGKLIVVRYSANQELVTFDVRANGSLSTATTGIPGFTGLAQPLDVIEDPSNGNLYVSELTNNFGNTAIKLLKPQGGSNTVGRADATPRVVFTEVAGGAASDAQNAVVRNTGAAPLTITGATISGTDAALFSRTGSTTFPITVPANGTANLPVAFNPTTPGPRGAILTISTDSAATPTVRTTLRGLGTLGVGGSNEPSLQWILDTLQLPVDVGDPDPTTNDMPVGSALLGDEVEVDGFRADPFDNIVRIEPLSLFGPSGGNGNVVTVGLHDSADPASRTVVGVGPNLQNQKVLPTFTGLGPVTGMPDSFGFDFTWHGLGDRVTYQEDALNTWSAANPHKVRVYPLKNTDGSVEPYAYILAPEDVPTGVDFQDAAVVVRNVQPVVTAGQGQITADAPEAVFTAVKGTTSPQQTVRVTNTGTTPLTISSVVLTGAQAGEFTLVGGGPETVAVGGSASYTLQFKPLASVEGTRSAALRITSDDADTQVLDIGLYGLSLRGLEGGNEPPLADVVRTLGRTIDVGWSGLTNDNPATGTQLEGEEVRAPLFTRANAGPVTMKPVARFSPDERLPFGWYLPTGATPERNQVAAIAAGQFQTLNPAVAAGGATGFDPGGATFGFYVDSLSFNRSSYTQDSLNTGVPHAVRTYPARDRAGAAIPNTYLVTFEDASNGDYQDYVFEVSNVRVAGSTGGTTPVARVDFGPATSTVATGYTRDSGTAFTTGGSGWVNQASGAPQSMTAFTRDRATTNLNQGTLILMQPTAAQSADGPGAWRYTLPNGTYAVTVGVGDPAFDDSVHRINVEGQTVVAGYTPTASARSTTGTATVEVTDGVLDVDAAGGTNTKLQYVDISRPLEGTDTTPPEVRATVSGLQQTAGSYKRAATVTVAASDPESSVSVVALSVDGGPFQPYTAPVEVTGLGDHTTRARAQNGAGLFTTTASQTFTVVAGGASRADIALSNVDGVPFADRLVMSRIQTPAAPPLPANVVHDVSTLRIANNGTEGLNVTSLGVTGPFTLVDGGPTLPALVAPGSSLDVRVRFTATSIGAAGGLYDGTLTVGSDDADQPSLPVELAGFWQSVSEGGQEPDLIELARLFGYTTQIVSPGQPLNQNGLLKANGEEILSPYWLRANAGLPVTVRQLAAFHTQGNVASFFWHAKGSSSTTNVLTHVGVDGQSVLPRKNDAANTPGIGSFSPTGAFGLKIDSEWSDPVRNNSAIDRENGCAVDAQCGHHVRVWPARDRSGAIIANTYLVGMDYSGINYDYNDNVYLVSNIKPETAADPSTSGPIPGAAGLELGFEASVDGTVADRDGQGTGFRSTQPNKRDVTPGSSSYDPSLLDLVPTDGGTLRVTSSGTATEGTNGSADNTLVNGLRLPFDGTGDPFSVVARTVGPVTNIDSGSEQVGIQLGNDQDNFVKVAIISKTVGGRTGPAIEFLAEQNGVGATIGTPVLIPDVANVTGVELALLADPGARTVRAAFRTDDGAWTVLPTAFVAPPAFTGRLFDVRSQAGILVSHKGGTQLVGVYDTFAVRPGDVAASAQPTREALLRVDTGSASPFTDGAGRVWAPDTGTFTPASAPAEGNRTDPIAGTTDDALYATYRGNVGSLTPRTLTYALPTRAASTVDLRLHFAERSAGNAAAGRRLFDIDVEGRTVRTDFDVFRAAGGLDTATVLRVNNVTVSGGVLDLALRASVDYPAISAIEVLCPGACPVDTTAPTAPTGVRATGAQAGNTITWDPAPEADVRGYRVYRAASSEGPFTELTDGPVDRRTFVDTTAPANQPSSYRVVAVDTSDNASEPSSVVTATRPVPVQNPVRINAGGPAQTVGGVTWEGCTSLTSCAGRVSGGFSYSENDTISGLPARTNNTIFQSEWTGGATGAGVVPVGTRAFGFAVPVLNGPYTVRLYFAELNKNAANQRTFDVRLEGATAVSGLDVWAATGGIDRALVKQYPAVVTDGVMSIDFIRRIENAKVSAIEILPGADTTAPTAPASLTATGSANGVALTWPASASDDIAGYQVYRSATPDSGFVKLNDTPLVGTAYADSAAPSGARSYYQVRTVDTAGNESAPVSADAARPVAAPSLVTGVTATASQNGITIGWTASAAAGLTGYRVYRSTSATGTFTRLGDALVSGTTYTDSTAPAGAPSFYQVTAVNPSGESPRSATVTATRPVPAPSPVTGVTATGAESGIRVTWAASDASGLTGYQVYRSSSATGTFTRVNGATVTGTSYLDTSAPVGARSFYQVTAVNPSGESPRSATVDAIRPAPVPAPAQVTGLTATGSQSGIRLTWAASDASGLTGYQVYRSSSASGTFTRVNGATVTGTSYDDTSAPAGARSFYQVTAVNPSGESPRSATVDATRPGGAQPVVRINTGGPAQTVGSTTWSACSSVTTCSGWVSGGFAHSENDTVAGVPGRMNNTIFQSEWTGGALGAGQVPAGQRAFGFAVPVQNGSYQVRLHFAELNKDRADQRRFDVRLEGATVLSNFDIWQQAGGIDRAIVRQFEAGVTDGVMTIDFVRRIENAKISAIEIIPTDTSAPVAVTGVTASGTAQANTVTWAGSAADDLVGYHLYRATSANGPWTRLTSAPTTGLSYTDSAAAAGARSYYQVTAVDASGNESVRSLTVDATRVLVRPTIRINTGGPAQTVGSTTWSACSSVTSCSGWVSGGFTHSENDDFTGVPSGMNTTIFRSEWTGGAVGAGQVPVGQRAFGFTVPVPDGGYRVRLHFAELNKNRAAQRRFDVRLEGATVLSDFDIFQAAGGIDRAIVREFDTSVTDGAVSIDFIRRVENAKISAIEIIPVG